MTLAEFKSLNKVSAINLYPSTKSDRLAGRIVTNKGSQMVVTTKTFDAKQPVFVYPTDITDEETGEINEVIILSNKEPKEATLVL